jgi:hypothetical protein
MNNYSVGFSSSGWFFSEPKIIFLYTKTGLSPLGGRRSLGRQLGQGQ